MKLRGRSTYLSGLAAALCLTSVLGGSAFAGPAGGVKGDPQPEAKPFRVSNQDLSPASIAFEPNGSLVAAFDVPGGTTHKAEVCVLNRSSRSCARKVDLGTPTSGDSWDTGYGPQVLVPSANHVVLIGDVCCDTSSSDTLMYSSTDGGRTFGPFTRIGSVSVGGAVLIGKQIVFIGADFPQGVQVESVPVSGASPPASVATLASSRNDVGIGAYHGGVLAGYDNDGKIWQTFVKYAPAGSDFNAGGSFRKVITISNESLLGVSVTAYPVLQPQAVSFRLKSSSIGKGKSTTGAGQGSPAAAGRLVILQVERSGRWYDVKGATAHETNSGKFSFTIKGKSAGRFSYRAVVSDLAGYLQFGYSSARSLKVS
jgi:hypothetical protein